MTEKTERQILHIALVEDWDAAQLVGQYEKSTIGRTLAEEGFIHCSFPSYGAFSGASKRAEHDENKADEHRRCEADDRP